MAKKVAATSSSLPSRPANNNNKEDWVCPHCGGLESKGGCEDPAVCAQAIAKREAEYAGQITNLVDQSNHRSLPLLMVGFEALDLLNIGLIVTTGAGTLLMANRVAEQILESHDGLELTASGVFQEMAGCGPALSGLLQQAARPGVTAKRSREDAVVAIQRPSGKRPLTLLVRAMKRSPAEGATRELSALVFILDPQLPIEAAENELRQLYGLTSTEARLANLLMEGKNLDECCEQLAIRCSTGRTHLRHLFEKVGVQRQSELVALLLKSIGLIRIVNKDREPIARTPGQDPQDAFLKLLMNRRTRMTHGV
jgi:DNA-binding CsgD family transcriptional regulator